MTDMPDADFFRLHESPGTKTFAVSEAPPVFVRGSGACLFDTERRRYLDFASGSGSTVLGHAHPTILAQLAQQAETGILHIGPHFHTPSQRAFVEYLLERLPAGLDMVQPATNGTEATEAALKIAMHATGRRRFLAFEGAYHGRTLGALAVSPARGANEALGPFSPDVVVLSYPCLAPGEPDTAASRGAILSELTAALEAVGGDFAGLILEPIQATAGMRALLPEAVPILSAHARTNGIPIIADEVFTGFGRTGSLFFSPTIGLEPDLLVLAKSLGGGIPAGLVAGRRELMSRLPRGAQSSTFQLHPLAAATGLAMLRTIDADDLLLHAEAIGSRLARHIPQLNALPGVIGVQGVAAMWGVAIGGAKAIARTKAIRRAALAAGLITWECGLEADVIGLVPPLVVTNEEIDQAAAILLEAIRSTP